MQENKLFLLGGADLEMAEIRILLNAQKQNYIFLIYRIFFIYRLKKIINFANKILTIINYIFNYFCIIFYFRYINNQNEYSKYSSKKNFKSNK